MKKNENGYPCFNVNSVENQSEMLRNGMLNSEGTVREENERSYERMSRAKEGCSKNNNIGEENEKNDCNNDVPLAYVYAPVQKFCMLYSPDEALKHGTLFEKLYKPLGVYGNE